MLTLIVSSLAAAWHVVGAWLLTTIGSLYAVANLSASVMAASGNHWRHLPLLPLVFAILTHQLRARLLVGTDQILEPLGRYSHDSAARFASGSENRERADEATVGP